jgi:DUF971 family protein/molybdopterin converting factor small subunit
MSKKSSAKQPTAINLHSKSRLLVIEFADGKRFELPCEYLRVFSPAKEVRTLDGPVTGKEQVNIEEIEPQGQYAVRLHFDDGHDTGIYSWDTLYELGENRERNWQEYLKRLEQSGYTREQKKDQGPRRIRLLYFTYLVKKFGKESEQVTLPDGVADVQTLLNWLRRKSSTYQQMLREDSFRVTVNKQFSEPFTRLEDGDEVALIPNSPNPPAPE